MPAAIPVIFTTAYDHYAVQAFRFNSIDYLLKPIDSEELHAALEKVKPIANSPSTTDAIAQLLACKNTHSFLIRLYLLFANNVK